MAARPSCRGNNKNDETMRTRSREKDESKLCLDAETALKRILVGNKAVVVSDAGRRQHRYNGHCLYSFTDAEIQHACVYVACGNGF